MELTMVILYLIIYSREDFCVRLIIKTNSQIFSLLSQYVSDLMCLSVSGGFRNPLGV